MVGDIIGMRLESCGYAKLICHVDTLLTYDLIVKQCSLYTPATINNFQIPSSDLEFFRNKQIYQLKLTN